MANLKADPFAVLAKPPVASALPAAAGGVGAPQLGAMAPSGAPAPAQIARTGPLAIVAVHLVRRILPAMVDEPSFQIGKRMIAAAVGPQLAGQLGDHFDPARMKQAGVFSAQLLTRLAMRHVQQYGPTHPMAPAGGAPAPGLPPGAPAPVGLASMGGAPRV